MANSLIKSSKLLYLWQVKDSKVLLITEPENDNKILFIKPEDSLNYKPIGENLTLDDFPDVIFKGGYDIANNTNIGIIDKLITYDTNKVPKIMQQIIKNVDSTMVPIPTATEVKPIEYQLWKYDFTSKDANLGLTSVNQYITDENGYILYYKPQGYTQEYLSWDKLPKDQRNINSFKNYKFICFVKPEELLNYNKEVQNDQKKELDALGAVINKRVPQPSPQMKVEKIDFPKEPKLRKSPGVSIVDVDMPLMKIDQQRINQQMNYSPSSWDYSSFVQKFQTIKSSEPLKSTKKPEPIPDPTKRLKRKFDLD